MTTTHSSRTVPSRPYPWAVAVAVVLAMLATALTQVVVTAVALLAELHRDVGGSAVDTIGVTAVLAAGFCLSAWLFSRAAATGRPHGGPTR